MAERRLIEFEGVWKGQKLNKGIADSGKLQEKHLKKTLKLTEKVDKATRAVSNDIKKYEHASEKAYSQALELQSELLNAHKDDEKAIKHSIENLGIYVKEMQRLRDANDDIRKQTKERLATSSKEIRKARELLTIRESIAELHEEKERRGRSAVAGVAGYGGHQMAEDIGDSMKEALSSLGGRDFGGMAKGLAGALGGALKGAGGGLMRAGASAGPGPMGAVLGKMGSMISTVAKLGPLIMSLSSVILAIVKMILDADAAFKDFNKEVLATTSTSGLLKKNFNDSGAAAADLESTMRDMYRAATSLDNLDWGISKEQFTQVNAGLGAQGVLIDKTIEYFDDLGKGHKKAEGYVKDWGTMVQMSVGYSRAFGVSLQEVTDLQGEMMSELGMGFDDVQAGFEAMKQGADDAGVASGKFFAQMRGISADLSLFNMRIGDAAKLMSKLDKAMSPRKAAEFFQTITKFFKGMGLMDRAKMVLMAGTGATKGILKKDLDSKVDSLSKDLDKLGDGMGQEFKDALGKKGQLIKFMARHDGKLNGELRDAIVSAGRQSDKIQRGGIIDLASALKDASPFAAMDEVEAMSKRMFGKPLEELTGVEVAAVEQAANINDEQLDQFAKLKDSLDVQKEVIAQKVEDGTDLTDEEKNMMQKLGINFKAGAKDKEAADALRAKDSKKVWDNMSKSQQDLLRDSAGTLDQAKRQGDLTQSLVDKLGVIMDFLLREIYDALMGIYDGFLDLLEKLGVGDAQQRKMAKATSVLAKSKDRELVDAAKNSKNMNEMRSNLEQTSVGMNLKTALGPEVDGKMADILKEVGKQGAAMKDMSLSEADRAKAAEAWKKASSNYSTMSQMQFKAQGKLQKAILDASLDNSGAFQGFGSSVSDTFEKAYNKMLTKPVWGKDPDLKKLQANMKKGMDALKSGKTMSEAMKTAGLDEKQQKIFQQELLDTLSPEQYAKLLADYSTDYRTLTKENAAVQGGGGSASGQQAQSDKAAPVTTPTTQAGGTTATTTATTTPTTPAQQAGTTASTKPVTPTDMQDATDQQGQNIQNSMDGLALDMKNKSKGIVFNGPYLKGPFGSQMEMSMYNAASRALFEYYMYSDLDRDQAMKAIKAGVNPRDVGASFLAAVQSAPSVPLISDKDWRNTIIGGIKQNADGGTVKGPMPGNEMLALVGKGEKIVPAGGGGGGQTIRLELAGDLKRIIRAETLNTLNDHDRARPRR